MDAPKPQDSAPSPVGQFEFTGPQNAIIEQLSSDMRWVALPIQLIGILYGVALVMAVIKAFQAPRFLLEAVLIGLAMLFFLAVGFWTSRASSSFQQIVSTKERDITHLMAALDDLRKQYKLLSAIVKVYVALIVVWLILNLITLIVVAVKA